MEELREAFTRASKAMTYAVDSAVRPHGVRVGQNLLLRALAERDGQTPGEVARRLWLTTPTVVKMAQRMEATGLVRRERDRRDGRLVHLYLTERGRTAEGAIEVELDRLMARATASLTEDERRHLARALGEMAENLRPVRPGPLEED
jgi:MarR family transcriptional regulator, organic hydroperoxide resistance regulator